MADIGVTSINGQEGVARSEDSARNLTQNNPVRQTTLITNGLNGYKFN